MILHIILTILKILGILLLVLLGILLALLLIVLFDPVCYRAEGKKEGQILEGSARISWLFRLIQVRAVYAEKKGSFEILLLGIPVSRYRQWIRKRKKKKRKKTGKRKKQKAVTDPKPAAEEIPVTEETPAAEETPVAEGTPAAEAEEPRVTEPFFSAEKTETEPVLETEQNRDAEENMHEKNPEKAERTHPVKKILHRLRVLAETVWNLPSLIRKKIQKMQLTWTGICDKIKQWYTFLNLHSTKQAIAFLKQEAIVLLRHILPGKVKGDLHFGFEDPAHTGQMLAVLAIGFPWYGKNLQVVPDFEQPILEGHLKLRGHITGVFLLWHGWKIYRKKEIKEIWKKFREKEE